MYILTRLVKSDQTMSESVRFLHHIDHGVRLTQKIYGAVAPVINSLAGNVFFLKKACYDSNFWIR